MGDPTTHLLKSSTRYSISCATGGRAEGEERWEKVRADDTGAFSRCGHQVVNRKLESAAQSRAPS